MKHRAIESLMHSAAGAHHRLKHWIINASTETGSIFFVGGNGLQVSLNQTLLLLVFRCFSGGGDKDTGEREKDNKKATRPHLGTALLQRPHIIGGYVCEEGMRDGQEVDHRGVWSSGRSST